MKSSLALTTVVGVVGALGLSVGAADAAVPAVSASRSATSSVAAIQGSASPGAALAPAAAVAPAATIKQTVVIGRSRGGRPIVANRLGDPTKPTVVLLTTIHGNERRNHTVAASLKEGRAVQGINLWVVEFANPDGWAKGSRYNAAGVDLNRNFPVRWSRSTTRAGARAASEPEARALMAFLDKTNPTTVLSLHQPLYGVDGYALKDKALAQRLAKNLALPLRSFSCTSGCTGTLTQWFNATHRGRAITVEFGKSPSWGAMVRAADGILRSVGGRR